MCSSPFCLFCLPLAEPLSLMDLCRRSVRVALGRDRLSEIHRLPLPASLKNYLLYQWRSWLTKHILHSLVSFSGIVLGFNPFGSITEASRTDIGTCVNQQVRFSVSCKTPLEFLILFLWLFSIVIFNFVKSGITEYYAHTDPTDALTVTVLVNHF